MVRVSVSMGQSPNTEYAIEVCSAVGLAKTAVVAAPDVFSIEIVGQVENICENKVPSGI